MLGGRAMRLGTEEVIIGQGVDGEFRDLKGGRNWALGVVMGRGLCEKEAVASERANEKESEEEFRERTA